MSFYVRMCNRSQNLTASLVREIKCFDVSPGPFRKYIILESRTQFLSSFFNLAISVFFIPPNSVCVCVCVCVCVYYHLCVDFSERKTRQVSKFVFVVL